MYVKYSVLKRWKVIDVARILIILRYVETDVEELLETLLFNISSN